MNIEIYLSENLKSLEYVNVLLIFVECGLCGEEHRKLSFSRHLRGPTRTGEICQ